ncbi:hypothetical protein [Caulobacter endophyticus]|uniref:Uncharacterized protein n=1 Tax=Caulobacter endophyticus TaxID=2172652 RepID=A0A2T9JH02_9CAUL|nr:hypothetical protein [Caulobacter endophyticus]PVM82981.1 hypothetical protein DDF67_22090 [Caulobacter endophyticus]
MANPVSLLAPALIPSWNFFDVIAASPRVEYALADARDAVLDAWTEFRPRPQRLSPVAMLARLFWNARWNESLFLVSCAERLVEEPTAHGEDEIFRRIAADLAGQPDAAPWLSFRLLFIDPTGEREVLYQAAPRRLADLDLR